LEAFRNDNSKCNYTDMVLLNEFSMIDDSTMDCELSSIEKRQKLAIQVVLSYPAESSFPVGFLSEVSRYRGILLFILVLLESSTSQSLLQVVAQLELVLDLISDIEDIKKNHHSNI